MNFEEWLFSPVSFATIQGQKCITEFAIVSYCLIFIPSIACLSSIHHVPWPGWNRRSRWSNVPMAAWPNARRRPRGHPRVPKGLPVSYRLVSIHCIACFYSIHYVPGPGWNSRSRSRWLIRGANNAAGGVRGAPGPPGGVDMATAGSLPEGGGGALQEPTRVRTEFPEAWIWADLEVGYYTKISDFWTSLYPYALLTQPQHCELANLVVDYCQVTSNQHFQSHNYTFLWSVFFLG